MEALGVGAGVLSFLYLVFAILLVISPLMIWSKTSQLVKLQKETNLCLKILAKQADPTIKFPG